MKRIGLAVLSLIPMGALASESNYSLALGLTPAWRVRPDYGSRDFHQFTPELVAFGYLPLHGALWARPEARAALSMQNPDMPKGLRIEESDLTISGGVSLLWNWYLVPALGGQASWLRRTVRLVTSGNTSAAGSHISRTDSLFVVSGQGGLGFPAVGGRVVFEPWVRYSYCKDDERLGVGYGLDATVAIF